MSTNWGHRRALPTFTKRLLKATAQIVGTALRASHSTTPYCYSQCLGKPWGMGAGPSRAPHICPPQGPE